MADDVTSQISDQELNQIVEQHGNLVTRYEQLFSFIYDLRLSDFQISPPQFIAVQRLLLALTEKGENRLDFQNLKTYLAPLICSSPEEQTAFYEHFDLWLKTHKPPDQHPETPPTAWLDEKTSSTNDATDEKTSEVEWRRKPAFIATAFLTTVFTAIIFFVFYFQTPDTKTFSGFVRDKTSEQPISGAEIVAGEETHTSNQDGSFSFKYEIPSTPLPLTVRSGGYQTINSQIKPDEKENPVEFNMTADIQTSLPPPAPEISKNTPTVTPPTPTPPLVEQTIPPLTFYQRYYLFILLAVFLLPFLIYGLWNLWWLWRRRQLERWRERNQPNLKQLTLKREEDFLYRNPAFRRTIQELRRHRQVRTNTLDIGNTVEATLREGGLFTPVLGRRQISPEYLVLIDRLGFHDQKSRLEDKILDRFKKEGVFFECFYFNGDPRLCLQKYTNRKDETPKYFHLQELSLHYPEHRLLIFSDGAGMVDDFTNRPHRWIDLLSEWETRALLTPNSALGYHQWILEQENELPVLPAHEGDLKTLLEIIRTGEIPKAKAYNNENDYPPTFTEDYEQWWMRRAAPRRKSAAEKDSVETSDKTEKLCLELRYYLGADGYLLLCACAVYPELAGDLTFYLAHRFIEAGKREATLESLVCLPWFRHGFIPDWLREKFLSELTFEQERKIRDAIERLLTNYLTHPQEGFSLEIAESKPAAEETLWKRLRRFFRNWRSRKFFRDIIKTEPENSPLKDYVFLRFVSGSKLAVSLPRKLSRFLQLQSGNHSGFLRHFYRVFSDLVKAAGNLWRKIYRMDIPLNGMPQRTAIIGTAFVSVLAVLMLLQIPLNYPTINPEDSLDNQLNTPEDDLLSLTNKAFAFPTPKQTFLPTTAPSQTITPLSNSNQKPSPTIPPSQSPTEEDEKTIVTNVMLILQDKDTDENISGTVTLTQNDGNDYETFKISKNGSNALGSFYAGNYTVESEAEGYIKDTRTVDIEDTISGSTIFIELKKADDKITPNSENRTPDVAQFTTPTPSSTPTLIDEFPNVPSDEFKARLDNAGIQLANNPGAKLYFFLYDKSPVQTSQRSKTITDYLKSRGVAPIQIVIKTWTGSFSKKTEIYLVPNGAPEPTPKSDATTN